MSNTNNEADMQNPNKDTDGTNKAYDQNQGNRGKQLNSQEPKSPRTTCSFKKRIDIFMPVIMHK